MNTTTMTSPAPETAPSGKLEGEGDTTLALATMMPYLSDGPTLPLVGGANEDTNGTTVNGEPTSSRKGNDPKKGESSERPKKKQKTSNSNNMPTVQPAPSTPKMDLEPLYNPWTLLPPELLKTIESQLGGSEWWEKHCIPIAFTKNQNVKSGINRLKAYLTCQRPPNSSIEWPEQLERDDVLIAVSAQGEATTKLVGIVEMVKRVVKPSGGEGEGRGEMWCLYTSLSSRVVGDSAQRGGNGQEKRMEDEEDFEMLGDADEVEESEVKIRKIPVLTAWMSRKSVVGFKNAFGERTFEVVRVLEDD